MNRCDFLYRIANHLMMKSAFIDDIGLYHGKMGIILFFFHFSKYANNSVYEDFANELLNDLYDEISVDMPLNFEYGLSGIGWGLHYILQNQFVEGDVDIVLSEIDNKIMECNLCRMQDETMKTGSKGILCYINKRIFCNSDFFETSFVLEIEKIKSKMCFCDLSDDVKLLHLICSSPPKNNNILNWPLGLMGGCAGLGLKLVMK